MLVMILGIGGLAITKGVDAVRTAFDKHDRVPKAYWLLLSQGLGIAIAYGISQNPALLHALGLPMSNAFETILAGAGFGGLGSFLHEVQSALSAVSGPAATPKGLLLRLKGPRPERRSGRERRVAA